jgi:hypothetical protein
MVFLAVAQKLSTSTFNGQLQIASDQQNPTTVSFWYSFFVARSMEPMLADSIVREHGFLHPSLPSVATVADSSHCTIFNGTNGRDSDFACCDILHP